jgi:hypothetical protein
VWGEDAVLNVLQSSKGTQVVFCNSLIVQFLRKICGQNSHKKQIPSFMFSVTNKNKENLITAMWRGDGCEKHRRNFTYSSCSKKLLTQLRELLLDLGVISGVRFGKRDNTVYVQGIEWIKLKQIINSTVSEPNIYKTHSKHFRDNTFVYFSIRKIERIPYHGSVYSLKVDKDETYTTCTATVHNSLDATIVAAGGESAIKVFQRLRCITPFENKSHAIIVDFLDPYKYLRRHSKKREKLYKSEPSFRITYKSVKAPK